MCGSLVAARSSLSRCCSIAASAPRAWRLRRSMACAAADMGSTFSADSAWITARASSPRMASLAMASSMCARASPTLSSVPCSVATRACSKSSNAPGWDMSAGNRTDETSGLAAGDGRGGSPFRGSGGGIFDGRSGRCDGTGSAAGVPVARATATCVGPSSNGEGMCSAWEGRGGRMLPVPLCSDRGRVPAAAFRVSIWASMSQP